MSSSTRYIHVGEGVVKLPGEKKMSLPKRPNIQNDQPIAVLWSLYGKPSDLVLVQRYAEKLGISVTWCSPKLTQIEAVKKAQPTSEVCQLCGLSKDLCVCEQIVREKQRIRSGWLEAYLDP